MMVWEQNKTAQGYLTTTTKNGVLQVLRSVQPSKAYTSMSEIAEYATWNFHEHE